MELVRSLLSSKKFVAALLAVATGIAVKLGVPEAKATEIGLLVAPFLAYIGGQGLADFKKEAAKQ